MNENALQKVLTIATILMIISLITCVMLIVGDKTTTDHREENSITKNYYLRNYGDSDRQ